MLTVDYFSRYPEVTELATTTSAAVIRHLKNVFLHHGIPEVIMVHSSLLQSSANLLKNMGSVIQAVPSTPKVMDKLNVWFKQLSTY